MWNPVAGLLWWYLVTYTAQVPCFQASAQGQNQWNGFRPGSKGIAFSTPHPTSCGRVETPISKAWDMGTAQAFALGLVARCIALRTSIVQRGKCLHTGQWSSELYASATCSMPALQWPGVHSSPLWYSAGPWWCEYQGHTRIAIAEVAKELLAL
jgi:hypothetical protein